MNKLESLSNPPIFVQLDDYGTWVQRCPGYIASLVTEWNTTACVFDLTDGFFRINEGEDTAYLFFLFFLSF